jgi:hypothetical protein
MINLRYHIVSLVAVFLALGLGIVMGSTVISRVTVDALNDRLDVVQRSQGAIREENARLGQQAKQAQDFAVTTRDQLLRGHLRNVPVMVVAVAGVDRRPVDELRQALSSAQANLEGTIWFTAKMRLSSDGDVRALATALDLPVGSADIVRRQALAKVAAAREGASAEVGDDVVAVPLVQAYAQASGRVVAAESGVDTDGGRAVFVGLLRGDTLAARLSTVDNIESPMGQTAAVLALEDLGVPRFGHCGVGPGAQRILPQPTP